MPKEVPCRSRRSCRNGQGGTSESRRTTGAIRAAGRYAAAQTRTALAPVIFVSWDDAQVYAAWLSKMTGKTYRLFTEAEREYAARAGTTTAYFWGNEMGYWNANCYDGCQHPNRSRTLPVGSFEPNAFGLYDMAGNGTNGCRIAIISIAERPQTVRHGPAEIAAIVSFAAVPGTTFHRTPARPPAARTPPTSATTRFCAGGKSSPSAFPRGYWLHRRDVRQGSLR